MKKNRRRKNPNAVALGQRGGKARLTRMTPERRIEVARLAAVRRWGRNDAATSPPPRSGQLDDRQSRLANLDEQNYRYQRRYLLDAGAYPVGGVAIAAYETMREIVSASQVARRDDIVFGIIFLLRSQYALEKGLTEILRLHFTDTMGIIRQVTEGAAFADRVRRHPHLAGTWLDAATDEKRYDVYREKFAPGKLFPTDDPPLKILGTWFDWASKHIHGSPFAFGMPLSMVSTRSGDQQLVFSYVDVKDAARGPVDLVRMYLAYLTVHLAALDVYVRLFNDALQPERDRWDMVYHQFDSTLAEYKRRLWPALIGKMAPTAGPGTEESQGASPSQQ